jgi:hypothetical protein
MVRVSPTLGKKVKGSAKLKPSQEEEQQRLKKEEQNKKLKQKYAERRRKQREAMLRDRRRSKKSWRNDHNGIMIGIRMMMSKC